MRRTIEGLPHWVLLGKAEWDKKVSDIRAILPYLTEQETSSILREYGYTTDWTKDGADRPEKSKTPPNKGGDAPWHR